MRRRNMGGGFPPGGVPPGGFPPGRYPPGQPPPGPPGRFPPRGPRGPMQRGPGCLLPIISIALIIMLIIHFI